MKTLTLLLVSFISLFAYGQDFPCGTPLPPAEVFIDQDLTRKAKRELRQLDDVIYRIPVYFTVIGDSQDHRDISDAFLNDQLRILNEDYRGLTPVTPPFTPTDMGMSYYAPLPVRRIYSDKEFTTDLLENNDTLSILDLTGIPLDSLNESGTFDMYDPNKGGAAILDPLHYVNCYYVNFNWAGGFSIFPRANTVGSAIDGNVMRIRSAFGTGRHIISHEIGHWFDLYHTFQPDSLCRAQGTSSTTPGDYCDDTPPLYGSTSGCPRSRLACVNVPGLPTNSQGQTLADVGNHMDYSGCEERFSFRQRVRARATLAPTGLRHALVSGTTPGNTPPVASWLSNDTTVALGSYMRVTGTATDDKSVKRLEFWYADLNRIWLGLNMSQYKLPITVGWTPSQGTHKYVLKAFDEEGAVGISDTLTLTVTGTPPPPPPPPVTDSPVVLPIIHRANGSLEFNSLDGRKKIIP